MHIGHISLAQETFKHFQLQEIRFIPCHQNPFKSNSPYASAEHRLQMLYLAIAPFKHFCVDTQEIQKNTPSYTIETLKKLRESYPVIPLAFILTSETFAHFTQWENWQEILDYSHLILTNRAGYEGKPYQDVLQALIEEKQDTSDHFELLHKKTAGHIFLYQLTRNFFISSTIIRARIAQKKKISLLVPRGVEDYINQHALYTHLTQI